MEEIIVSKVLENKPQGTELYSPMFGKCTLKKVINGVRVIQVEKDAVIYTYTRHGRYFNDGECLLFPSNKMRDWEKFQWKKGDILSDGLGTTVMFNGWSADDYIQFQTIYSVSDIPTSRKRINTGVIFNTKDFKKAFDYEKKDFIKKIEKEYNGKLNLKTLKIEKQPEFKDGDILHSEDYICGYIYICKGPQREVNTVYCYKLTGGGYLHICDLSNFYDCTIPSSSIISDKTRYATEEEKQQLFDALAKKGKRWNAETKTLEDLPKEHEFKPFEKVLIRDFDTEEWCASFFSHYADNDKTQTTMINDCISQQCIPYEGNEHLLGTTNSSK